MNVVPLVGEILGPDLLVILVVVALLFGSTRLPKLARSLGSAKAEFEKGIAEGTSGASRGPVPLAEERLTLTRSELDAMIAEREARGRAPAGPTPRASPPTSTTEP
jgi:sec-independent protein translocase protein TatA